MQNPFELIHFQNGTYSLKDKRNQQSMHSAVGPEIESQTLYIEQAEIRKRLLDTSDVSPLVIYDVGMGIAANAIQAIRCAEELGASKTRTLQTISFESDPQGLSCALENFSQFPVLQGYEPAIFSILEKKAWDSPDGLIQWRLLEGEFMQTLSDAVAPDIVFYDFYAPNTCPELWSIRHFNSLYEKNHGRLDLYTYTSSTFVRVALFTAGFFVGHGASTGMKSATTVASTRLANLKNPLGDDWLRKLERSSNRVPIDWVEQTGLPASEILERIRAHPQFGRIHPSKT